MLVIYHHKIYETIFILIIIAKLISHNMKQQLNANDNFELLMTANWVPLRIEAVFAIRTIKKTPTHIPF